MSGAAPIGERIVASEPVRALAAAVAGELPDAALWLVGGAVRDLLLGRPALDLDIAVAGEAAAVARALQRRLGGSVFTLSDRFGTWRVLAPQGWTIDVTALRGETIEQDLAVRDFSVNAMAVALADLTALIDPCGGAGDLTARRLRVLGERAYADDPLRPLRLARFVATLGFAPDGTTRELTARYAPRVAEAAPERIFAELRELVRGADSIAGVRTLEDLGLAASVLPELPALQGVDQSVYHHLDAHEHTIEVLERLLELERDLAPVFGEHAPRLAARLAEPLADELTRGEALRWAALLHDIAKRETRAVFEDGRVGFPRHDERGAEIVRRICARLHTSEKFARYVADLTRHHLRLGFLVEPGGDGPSPHDVYAYLRACEPVEVEVGVLSVADRLATRGRKSEMAIPLHLELARELNAAALAWREHRAAAPLVRGDELARAVGVEPGPRLGELLDAIDEARYVGEVGDAAAAIAFARERLAAAQEAAG